MLEAVTFDFGHTVMDELKGGDDPISAKIRIDRAL
jgi:hypothetical protein